MHPVKAVEVKGERSGKILFLGLARKNDFFDLSYIHSVEKVPVNGHFEVREDGTIRCVETKTPSFGPGLPFDDLTKVDGPFFSHYSKDSGGLESLSLLVSPESQQVIKIGGKMVELGNLAQGEIVTVRVTRRPWWEVVWHNAR